MSSSTRHKAILAVYLILVHEGKILLHLRQNSGYEDGKYSLVAGHVEAQESLKEAMIREAREEIGIDIVKEDLFLRCSMHRNAEDGERMDFFLEVKKWSGEIENKEPFKCRELAFFPLTALPGNLIDYVKEGVERSLKGISYCEIGW